jgi:hypothetical protein
MPTVQRRWRQVQTFPAGHSMSWLLTLLSFTIPDILFMTLPSIGVWEMLYRHA